MCGVSDARCVATVLVPRLAVIVIVPEQPWVGETVVGRESVPVARKEYGRGAVAARPQREREGRAG